MTRLPAAIAAFLLSGCATLGGKELTVGCQAADALTTVAALAKVGAVESNPLVAGVIHSVGIPGFLLMKAGMAYLLTRDSVPKEARVVANVVTCGAAVHNLVLL